MTRPLKILVVDDDKDNAASLGELFELEGYHVRVTHSGEDAVRAYTGENYDIAFMDVMMPGMNGVESFLAIRRMRPGARVFMMTGYSVEELLQQAISEGALGVLEKPFDASEVLHLSKTVGAGIVLADPARTSREAGSLIHRTLTSHGMACRHVTEARQLDGLVAADEVLVIDAQLPVIEGVSAYQAAWQSGHRAPTFIVPPLERQSSVTLPMRDIAITGVLTKPFDPVDLLDRLPALAA